MNLLTPAGDPCRAAVSVWTLDSPCVRARKGSCRAVQCGARRKVQCSAGQGRAVQCSAPPPPPPPPPPPDQAQSSTNMRVDRSTDHYLTRWLNFVSINEWLSVRTVASATFFSWFFCIVSFTLSDLPQFLRFPPINKLEYIFVFLV